MARHKAQTVQPVAPDFSRTVQIGDMIFHIKPEMAMGMILGMQRACFHYDLPRSEVSACTAVKYDRYVAELVAREEEPINLASFVLHNHMNEVDEKAMSHAYAQMNWD